MMMTPQGSGCRRRNRKKGKNRAPAGGEQNQHVPAAPVTAGPSTSMWAPGPNPIPNWRNPGVAHSFPARDALLLSTLKARVRSFLSSLQTDSPRAYSLIFPNYLRPWLEAHLRNHFTPVESDELWEQLLGWRPLHTPESARAMGTSVQRFQFPDASLFGPSRADYSRPAQRGWSPPWWQDHSRVARTWAAIGVGLGRDGIPVHLDYTQNPAPESSGNTPGAGRVPAASTPITPGGLIEHQFVPIHPQHQFMPTPIQARPGAFMSINPRVSGIIGSPADPGTSGAFSGNYEFQIADANAATAGTPYPSFTPLGPLFRRWPTDHGPHTQTPTSPMPIVRPRSSTPPHRHRSPVTIDDFQMLGRDAAAVSTEQWPAHNVAALLSSTRAPPDLRTPTPPVPPSRSSCPSSPPSPYSLAEEASVLLEVFCQSLSEGAANADDTQNRELIKGARDNVNKIWDTLWEREEGKGPPRHVHEDQDPKLMVYSGCVICYSEVAEAVLLPCNHLVLCLECCDGMGIKDTAPAFRNWVTEEERVKCPLCRAAVSHRIKIFRG